MNKTTLSTAIAAAMGLSTAAYAGHSGPINVNVLDGNGNLIVGNVAQFDENGGSTADLHLIGPLGTTLSVSETFTLRYQSNIVAFNDSTGTPITPAPTLNGPAPPPANNSYEFTVVADVVEHVDTVTGSSGAQTATFSPVAGSGKVAIYYDPYGATAGLTQKSNPILGTGFTDGTQIALMTITGGTSSFIQTSPGTGTGGTQFDFNLLASLDQVNTAYLQGIGGNILDIHFTSNQNYPPIITPAQYFDPGAANFPVYPVIPCPTGALDNTCDLLLQVDGLNTFTTTTPEPSSILLLGAGLSGLGLISRRRKQRG